MADIFTFLVCDDRSIQYSLTKPIMLEDSNVTQFLFKIPKVISGLDMSEWVWWLVYENTNAEKYSVPLTLVDDEVDPENYALAIYMVDQGLSGKAGRIRFALEVIDADSTTGNILHEWHTKTYSTNVVSTLQGNQTEFTQSEFDIISAKLEEIMELIEGGGGGGSKTSDDIENKSSVSGATVTDALDSLSDQIANKGTYSKPSGGIPKSDLASAVQTSLEKADTALQTAPVSSVNGKTGAVTGLEEATTIVTKTSSDTSQTLAANTFYVWPTMTTLTVTCPTTGGPYAFRFTSGSTATTLTMSGITMPDDFTVEANKVYEINVYQGYGLAASWAVS